MKWRLVLLTFFIVLFLLINKLIYNCQGWMKCCYLQTSSPVEFFICLNHEISVCFLSLFETLESYPNSFFSSLFILGMWETWNYSIKIFIDTHIQMLFRIWEMRMSRNIFQQCFVSEKYWICCPHNEGGNLLTM